MPPAAAQAVVDENAKSRINGLRAALAVLALLALVALATTGRLPDAPLRGRGGAEWRLARGSPDGEVQDRRRAQARRRVTLHQARFRHEGQVMRRSNFPRGSQTPRGNWKIRRSSTPTCEVWRHRWHSTVNTPRSSSGLPDVEARLSGSGRAPE